MLRFEKPKLFSFSLEMWCNKPGDMALLELARHAGTLRSFSYSGQLQNVSVLADAVGAAPLLEKARVITFACTIADWGGMDHETGVQRITEYVTVFAD